jgi:integrase
MARTLQKLTPLAVSKASKPGLYGDGGGLYLQIGPTGSKSWLFRFMLNGKSREMGLGPLHTINMTEARAKAVDCRKLLLEGIDPIEARKADDIARRLLEARSISFKECSEAYIQAHQAGWTDVRTADQWKSSLRDYVYPVIGVLPVAAIDTDLVMKCLSPIWNERTRTAMRVRARIESVLDWATTSRYRQGENPARWRGHLENLLAPPAKIARVVHLSALPYEGIHDFMLKLQAIDDIPAKALELAILTAARTGEVTGATWDEMDLDKEIWTVPAERMKMVREHRVPLSGRCMEILRALQDQRQSDYVFFGMKRGKPIHKGSMLEVVRVMSYTDITVHGFRSTFRDWAAEMTAYPREVAEMALAHVVESKVEAAYRRGDLFDKRRRMMDDWAKYCAKPAAAGGVVPINAKIA